MHETRTKQKIEVLGGLYVLNKYAGGLYQLNMDSCAVETQELGEQSFQNGTFYELFKVAHVVALAVTQKFSELLHEIYNGGLLVRRLQIREQFTELVL